MFTLDSARGVERAVLLERINHDNVELGWGWWGGEVERGCIYVNRTLKCDSRKNIHLELPAAGLLRGCGGSPMDPPAAGQTGYDR